MTDAERLPQRNTMTERDELGKMLFTLPVTDRAADTAPEIMRLCDEAAEVILDRGYTKPRQVSTVEELDALPSEVVILDARNVPREGLRGIDGVRNYWRSMGPARVLRSHEVALPATVLYSPVVAG